MGWHVPTSPSEWAPGAPWLLVGKDAISTSASGEEAWAVPAVTGRGSQGTATNTGAVIGPLLWVFSLQRTWSQGRSALRNLCREKCHRLCPPGGGLVDTTGPQGTASTHQGQDKLLL